MIFVISVATASANTWTVTKTADTADGSCNSDCSLREAIAAAAISGDNIVFAAPQFSTPQTILLADAAGFRTLLIAKSITIDGPGANLLTVRGPSTGPNKYRVFEIAIPVALILERHRTVREIQRRHFWVRADRNDTVVSMIAAVKFAVLMP